MLLTVEKYVITEVGFEKAENEPSKVAFIMKYCDMTKLQTKNVKTLKIDEDSFLTFLSTFQINRCILPPKHARTHARTKYQIQPALVTTWKMSVAENGKKRSAWRKKTIYKKEDRQDIEENKNQEYCINEH